MAGIMRRVHGGCRVNLWKQQELQRLLAEAPDCAYKLLRDIMEQSVLEKEAEEKMW